MLFLFENTLTHYIYIVFYTLVSRARLAHNLGKFYAMSRHATPTATPSPRSEQPHAHEQPHPNDIRAHTDRHTITNDPDNLHVMRDHTQNDTQGAHTDRNTITPPGFRIYDKSKLTASIPMGNSWAAAHL